MHVFLDLETLSTEPNAAILAIAAVAVDSIGTEISAFYCRIDSEQAKIHGDVSPDTVAWWCKQSNEAQAEAFGGHEHPECALISFADWYQGVGRGRVSGVWGNGPRADNVWLASAFERWGKPVPWPFYLDRDCRTAVSMCEMLTGCDVKASTPFVGTPHNALDDARHQAKYTFAAIRRIANNAT